MEIDYDKKILDEQIYNKGQTKKKYINSVIGYNNSINRPHNIVIGFDNIISGEYCIVIGSQNKVTGNNCLLVGNNLTVVGNDIKIPGDIVCNLQEFTKIISTWKRDENN